MDRNTALTYAGSIFAVAALIFAIVTGVKVGNIKESMSFDTTINVAVAGEENAAASETATTPEETPEEGKTESTEGQIDAMGAGMNIILHNGSLKLLNSWVRVPQAGNVESSEDMYVYLEGENAVKYNSTSGYLVVGGKTIVKALNAGDVTYNGIAEFMGTDGTPVLIGERKINDTSAIAVIYNLEGTAPATEEDVKTVQNILNNAKTGQTISVLTLFGENANPDWAEDMVMTERALQLIKGESSVYASPYTSSFAEGTTNTLNAGNISLSYSDNIKDTSTGYVPYIYEFNSSQNGQVKSSSSATNTLRVKFLAQSNMAMKDIFN